MIFAVYAHVRHFEFINYDDPDYITGNPHVQHGLTPEALRWAFTSTEAANWFPLTRLSHLLDVQLFGIEAGMYHLVSVLFHAGAALLLYAFLHQATQNRWPSAFVAFVFALHPLHVESVAWIAERKDVLCALFWFLALWAYVRYAERPSPNRYLLVTAAFVCGLLAKPMIVTLPFVLLLLDVWPLRRLALPRQIPSLLYEKVPWFALSAAAAIATFLVQQGSRAVKTFSVFPLALRVENALVAYATYILKTFWPANLAVFYPYPQTVPAMEAGLAALLLLGISILVLRAFHPYPYLAIGWLWYLGTLLPVIGIVQVGAQARADRYMYLPIVGLLIMLAWGAIDLSRRWPRWKPAIAVCALAACAACAISTSVQIEYWRNSETLFAHALSVTQRNYVAHHNLGLAIASEPGRLPEAVQHYRAALEIRPDSVEAHSDFGNALAQMGQLNDAAAEYYTALRLAPDSAIPHNNLGNALFRMGRLPAAIAEYQTAVRIQPDYAEAHNNLGAALASIGRTPEAIEQFKSALRLNPGYQQARSNLALAEQR
ncbi:MAG: tetratricopeptide repeat protein [Acidobacteriaceae bacterium]|nr:tetratricopeptide repeat protein [Acidobacteriaceae bacterium]